MLFAKEDARDEDIIEALKKAEAWDFIQQMPENIHTVIGERGVMLSGGQRQRLSIARVFLKNPKVLLFDEATSSLDSETEKKIFSSMEKLFEARTSIIITHRLSTIQSCDKIIFVENGNIVDIGTHDELKTRCQRYGELYMSQNF
jgi:ABC-type multidrug transport system fused ATPase/permease subunit